MTARFGPGSRYAGTRVLSLVDASGRTLRYLARRFVPAAGGRAVLHTHVVVDGERPDHLAARYLGDPQQSWRLCDSNEVTHPRELTATPGREVRITLPEGVPDPADADL